MSDYNWCHNPDCHTNNTTDRVRGVKGKKVLNGPPKGTATMNSKSLIQLFTGLKAGDDYESVTVNWGQMPTAIVEGTADVVMIPAMFPGPRVTQASAAGSMTMISMLTNRWIYASCVTEPV